MRNIPVGENYSTAAIAAVLEAAIRAAVNPAGEPVDLGLWAPADVDGTQMQLFVDDECAHGEGDWIAFYDTSHDYDATVDSYDSLVSHIRDVFMTAAGY